MVPGRAREVRVLVEIALAMEKRKKNWQQRQILGEWSVEEKNALENPRKMGFRIFWVKFNSSSIWCLARASIVIRIWFGIEMTKISYTYTQTHICYARYTRYALEQYGTLGSQKKLKQDHSL